METNNSVLAARRKIGFSGIRFRIKVLSTGPVPVPVLRLNIFLQYNGNFIFVLNCQSATNPIIGLAPIMS